MDYAREYCRQVVKKNTEPASLPASGNDDDSRLVPADSLHSVGCDTDEPID